MFVTCIGADYHTDYAPSVYPDWSEDSKMLWTEIENRMKEPTVLHFDKDKCLGKIMDEIKNQNSITKFTDYATSYHVGIISGLDLAYKIIEECVGVKENAKQKKV